MSRLLPTANQRNSFATLPIYSEACFRRNNLHYNVKDQRIIACSSPMGEQGYRSSSVGLCLLDLPGPHQNPMLHVSLKEGARQKRPRVKCCPSCSQMPVSFGCASPSVLVGLKYHIFWLKQISRGWIPTFQSRVSSSMLGDIGILILLPLLSSTQPEHGVARFVWKLCCYGAQPPAGNETHPV